MEDLCLKIFFFSKLSKLLLMTFYNKAGNVCFNICSQDFAEYSNVVLGMTQKPTSVDEGIT